MNHFARFRTNYYFVIKSGSLRRNRGSKMNRDFRGKSDTDFPKENTGRTMEKLKNVITLRIENIDTLNMLEKMYEKGVFRSKNEILNRALAYGLPILEAAIFGKGKKTQEESGEIARELAGLKNLLVQQSININVLENLLAFLYNVETAKAEGIEITTEFIESGCLETLPENIAEVKKEMTRIEFEKLRRKKE